MVKANIIAIGQIGCDKKEDITLKCKEKRMDSW